MNIVFANLFFKNFHYYVHSSFRFSTYIYKNLFVYVNNMTLLMTCVNVATFVLVQVSIPFIAKDIAILRLSVTGGGHLEFSHEKVDEKMETVLFQFFSVNISEKTQLFKIYMKKSQNDTMTYTSWRDGAISNTNRFTVTPFERRSTHTASPRSAMSYRIMTG